MGDIKGADASTEVNQWHDKQRRFQEWLALSSFDRVPLSQQALAAELHVREETLCRWKKFPGFMAEVHKLITASLGDVYHDVMHSFKQEATKGSYQHQRTYFEMLNVYTPTQQVQGDIRITVAYEDASVSSDSTD
jgi:hypothetical protein